MVFCESGRWVGSSFEGDRDLGFVDEFVVGVLGSGIVLGIPLVRKLAEQMADIGIAVAFLHVVGENAFFGDDHVSIGIACIVLFVIESFLMLELGVFNQLLLSAGQKGILMDRHIGLLLQIQLLSAELVFVGISDIGRNDLRE